MMTATAETIPIATVRRGGDATIRIQEATRVRLDELKAELFPDGRPSYDDVIRAVLERANRAGEISEDLATTLMARVEALEEVVHMIVPDPDSKYLFRADQVHHDVEGDGPKEAEGFMDDDKQGAFVKAPSGKILSELKKNLPPKVVEMVKREARKRRAAADLLEQAKKARMGR